MGFKKKRAADFTTDSLPSLESTGSSGGPAALEDSGENLVTPALVVANICCNLVAMTGAIFCWYFTAHNNVWGTGFFEGTFNIGAALLVLGVLVMRRLSNACKVTLSIGAFLLGIIVNLLVLCQTSLNLFTDIDGRAELFLKVTGHVFTIVGVLSSTVCLSLLTRKALRGAARVFRERDLEFGEAAFNYPPRSKSLQSDLTSAIIKPSNQQQQQQQQPSKQYIKGGKQRRFDRSYNSPPQTPLFTPETEDSVEQAYLAGFRLQSSDGSSGQQGRRRSSGDLTVVSGSDQVLNGFGNGNGSVRQYLVRQANARDRP